MATRTVTEIETELALCRTAISNFYAYKVGSSSANSRQAVRPFEGLPVFIQREKDLKFELQQAENEAAGQTPGLIVRYGVPTS